MSETRAPSPVFYGLMVVAIAGITVAAWMWSVPVAGRLLASMMVGLALLRLVLPTGTIPHIRNRFWDVVTLLALAAGVWYLSGWGDLTPIS